MSNKHLELLMSGQISFSSPAERSIFLQISYWGDKKGTIRMSQREIANETLYSLATVKRIFDQFQDEGLIERMGHGRYRLTETNGIIEEEQSIPQPKGRDLEVERLKAIRQPNQVLCFKKDGWPMLQER